MTTLSDHIGSVTSAYERFLTGDPPGPDVRAAVLASWQRCRSLGMAPDRLSIPFTEDLAAEERLLQAAGPVLDRLESALAGARVSVILTDGQARIIQRRAGTPELNRNLDAVQLAVGFGFAEPVAGTNGIGTALAERRPCLILGREHFAECMAPFACAGAPIRDPLSGRVEGVLDLTCLREEAGPAMLSLVRQAAGDIERRLLEHTASRERALYDAFLRSRGLEQPSGEPALRGPGGLLLPIGNALGRGDQALLRQQAAELLSSPDRVSSRVTLSDGRVAVLSRRPVADPMGGSGVAVEASLAPAPSGPSRFVTPLPSRTAASAGGNGPVGTGTVRPAPAGGTDDWLLLLGEPGVGQLALQARQRLQLLFDASVRIGTTLDVTRTAEELADVAVPQLADFVTVDLLEPVLIGAEPTSGQDALCRVALGRVREDSHLYPVGEPIRFVPSTPQARCLTGRQAVLEPVLSEAPGWHAQDPQRIERILAAGIHSLIAVPMQARGTLLGVVGFYRSERPAPFEEDDLSLAEELVGRAALCIDNARRYTREHTMALALQRSMLPRGLPSQSAVEVAHRYLPAHAGVGGDWYDVIPLSGARVALVVGDVVGHGVHAAATMGRLRTAVHNFSALDLPADDLLACLDDLVVGLDADQEPTGADDDGGSRIVGATCLYAVYDPVSRRCTLARAGHPVPALVLPDGSVEFPDVPAGPPLGLGGLPFETLDLVIPEGSELVLYSNGLVEDRTRDLDTGLALLRQVLARPGRTPEETCDAVLDALLPARPGDDIALLVARIRALAPDRVAAWDVSPDPENVSLMRAAVTGRLDDWGLADLAFTTELMVSELVTNAIRHARSPIQVRLLLPQPLGRAGRAPARTLICEVSDGSSTSPRMRRAASLDEGGRGLFLIAQLAARWGTRYTASGKVIWTEQALPAA